MAEKATPKGKTIYDYSMAVNADGGSIVNDKGLLLVVPITVPGPTEDDPPVFPGFDSKLHKPLKKTDFASVDVYMDYRANIAQAAGEQFLRLAETLIRRAEKIRQFGDDSTRRKADRLRRYQEQAITLLKQLREAGVDEETLNSL